jgi:hypothetical protein
MFTFGKIFRISFGLDDRNPIEQNRNKQEMNTGMAVNELQELDAYK